MYRTPEEIAFSNELIMRGIDFTYETERITLIEAFGKSKATTYLPDFIFTYMGYKVVIEVKGFTRNDEPLRHKLALRHYYKEGALYYVVRLAGTIRDANKGFYLYGKTPTKIRKNYPTIWEVIDKDIFELQSKQLELDNIDTKDIDHGNQE